ncbi:MAG TPA: thiamine-phosphate kinase [Candidatus Acidoferrum sp.]|nr:thiamine-phosphate kinase [Candidatus Acidoferrum sp.]
MRVRETEVIERIEKALGRRLHASREVRLGMGDDAALFRPRAEHELILTCDWFLEGTHFLRDKHPPDSVGWKCLARALSDVAAMGGVPRCFLLSLALPASHTGRWLDEFLGGLRRASRRFGCVLAGGDTTQRKEILANITVVGEIQTGRAMLRSGARSNDVLYVSGRLGEADSGLRLLKRSQAGVAPQSPLVRKHLYPEPRLALGQWLARKRLATAMLDISDGLSSDLLRLCGASQVGARVGLARLPLPPVPNATPSRSLQTALHGGDDYELLFTVPLHKVKFLPASFQGVPLTEIGRMTAERDVFLVEPNGRGIPLLPGGWDPFQEG